MMRALWDIINRDEIIRSSKEKEQCSAVAYRILGKFGGENRSSLREPATLEWKKFNTTGCMIALLDAASERKLEFALDSLIHDALEVIKDRKSTKEGRKAAVALLMATLTSFLPKDDEECNLENRIKYNLFHTKSDDSFRLQDSSRILRGGRRPDATCEAIQTTVKGLVLSLQFDECTEQSKSALSILMNHFILIDCAIYASPVGQQLSTESAADQNIQLVRIVDAMLSVFVLQEAHIDKISEGIFSLIMVAFDTAKALLEDPAKSCKSGYSYSLCRPN